LTNYDFRFTIEKKKSNGSANPNAKAQNPNEIQNQKYKRMSNDY